MYIVELAFTDDHRRLEARVAHRDQLRQLHLEGSLVMAGPWDDDSGAALVFNTDKAGTQQILAADPYYSGPGVRVASMRGWHPIVGCGQQSASP